MHFGCFSTAQALDTVKESDFTADEDIVEVFVREAPGELIQMEHWGCP